ncbi:hypothetical protein ANCDUO_19899 [Ancylostoma duodenale]|uniref:Uncharacterized protein n=1 Tax=Ancylostoma duodenale TaxID=51022 RepID=A0A0C2FN65_9BILA|nr:hypothetical protein ANCDUO_19899 [Ancylostoma duodenale]
MVRHVWSCRFLRLFRDAIRSRVRPAAGLDPHGVHLPVADHQRQGTSRHRLLHRHDHHVQQVRVTDRETCAQVAQGTCMPRPAV